MRGPLLGSIMSNDIVYSNGWSTDILPCNKAMGWRCIALTHTRMEGTQAERDNNMY